MGRGVWPCVRWILTRSTMRTAAGLGTIRLHFFSMVTAQQSKVSLFLKQHEQWSAWAFFTVMSGLVMYCMGLRGMQLLHVPLLGIMLLYVLKICAMYLRRSTAWALTCLCFAITPFYQAPAAELCMCLQVVTLCHVLGWVRGRRQVFCQRHFVVLGLAAGLTLLLLPKAAVFYAPVALLMLWVNRRALVGAVARALAGGALPLALYAGARDFMPVPAAVPCLPLWGVAGGVLLLLALAAMAVRKGRPERWPVALLALVIAWGSGVWMTVSWPYFLPLAILALVGVALLLHKFCVHRRALYFLRALGLLIPFVTLIAVLLYHSL